LKYAIQKASLPPIDSQALDIFSHSVIIPVETRSPITLLGRKAWEGDFETPLLEREVGFFV
jgi:hypothetical protein